DVTGFGLLGHLLELARGAGLRARVNMHDVPLLPRVSDLAASGYVTGASARNWAGYGHEVKLDDGITSIQRALLTDPQTSARLLGAWDASQVDEVLALFKQEDFEHAAVIGDLTAGPAQVEVIA